VLPSEFLSDCSAKEKTARAAVKMVSATKEEETDGKALETLSRRNYNTPKPAT
jgi:hypothetical protein